LFNDKLDSEGYSADCISVSHRSAFVSGVRMEFELANFKLDSHKLSIKLLNSTLKRHLLITIFIIKWNNISSFSLACWCL